MPDETFSLHPQLAADSRRVAQFELSDVRLIDDSRYLWCIVVPRLNGVRELHDVPTAEQALLWREICRVSTAMQSLSNACKMNVAALGNIVEQLHVHVIARQQEDAAWPGPVWGKGAAVPYMESVADELVERLSVSFEAPAAHSQS